MRKNFKKKMDKIIKDKYEMLEAKLVHVKLPTMWEELKMVLEDKLGGEK